MNEASLFWVFGLVVVVFVMWAIVVSVLVWKITRRVLMGISSVVRGALVMWERVSKGEGKRDKDGGTGRGGPPAAAE